MKDSARRRMLARLAASGALAAGGVSGFLSRALAKGDAGHIPGVQRVEGSLKVAGRAATPGTPVKLGDRLETGPDSSAVVVVGKDAFLMRSATVIVVKGEGSTLSHLLVETGRLLSVFAKKPVEIEAHLATIGIRGTGCYLEVAPDEVYFCLCYGEARVDGPNMPTKLVKTKHHDSPMLLSTREGAMRADPGSVRNHTDAELVMLEALVGREPPFMRDGRYPAGNYGSG